MRIAAAAGLEADEAVFDDVDTVDAVLASQSISREEDTGRSFRPLNVS